MRSSLEKHIASQEPISYTIHSDSSHPALSRMFASSRATSSLSRTGWQYPNKFQLHNVGLSRSLIARQLSTATQGEPPRRAFHRARTIARYTGYLGLSSIFGVLVLGAGFFVHDVFTYSERHVDRVPVSPLALKPERGGPKNLPIVRVQVDDEEDEENSRLAEKPKLVIVGGGWGVCFLSCLYHAVY